MRRSGDAATFSGRPPRAHRLSITQRLTLTSATFTAGVLLPAGFNLYSTTNGSIERERARDAESQARSVADALRLQWDEDLVSEYGGRGEFFNEARVEFNDWAIIRPNGKVERASGLFSSELRPVVAEASRLVVSRGEKSFRIASVPLMQSHKLRFEDLPETARLAIARARPSAAFLRAKREALNNQSIFVVKMLDGDRILETKITHAGEILSQRKESLPKTLPPGLIARVIDGMEAYTFDSITWAAHSGQLVAVVRRRMPQGGTFEAAVNRVGERFALNALGEVTGPEPAWTLHVAVAMDATSEMVARRALSLALCIGGPLAWIAMALGGLYVARKAMSPVQGIVEAVKRIELTQLGQRLPVQGVNDELSRIAATINGMLDRIEQGYNRERRFTGDASHELRTPLAKVIAEIDLALFRGRQNEEYRTALQRCRGYAETMQRLVESLLTLARLDGHGNAVVWKPFDMGDVALETIDAITSGDAARIELDLGTHEDPPVAMGERDLIGILLRNLVENALRYSPVEKRVRINIVREREQILVQVEDEGPGIPEEQLGVVFERFYRLDTSRSRETGGVGLGLSIAHAIGQLHRTRVKLARRAARGTVATFSLPVANGEGG